MKKFAAISGLLVFIIFAGAALASLGKVYSGVQTDAEEIQISGQVSSIVLRDGSSGSSAVITDESEISHIVSQINELHLRRGEKMEPHTGWEFALDICLPDREKPLRLIFRNGGFEQEGYFYGADKEASELQEGLMQKISSYPAAEKEGPEQHIDPIGQTCGESSGPTESAELMLGCFGIPYWIQGAVDNYNKKSEYVISIVDYWQEDMEEAVSKMYNDMLAGKGPDIICFESSMVNDAALGRAGMLEDLTAYLEESDVIGPEDFVEPLYEALEMDGRRYVLPTNFAVETIITKEKWAGGEDSWTPEECLRGVEENKELAFGIDKGNIADILGMYGLCCTPDGRNNVEAYLKMAQYLPEQSVFLSDYGMKRDGKAFMEFTWLSSVESYLYDKGQWGDDIRYMGAPGAEGNGMAFVPINGYGISAESRYKEEAWRFIESLFAEEKRKEFTPDHYFSARKDGLEEQFRRASKIEYYRDENGNLAERPLFVDRSEGMKFYAARQEDLEEIREIIDGTRLMRRENQAAVKLIREEAEAFYAGNRALSETAGIIENKTRKLFD